MGYKLPHYLKLKSASQFRLAFQGAKKSSSRYLALFYRSNRLAYSRLGIIIAKRNISKAVDRNRLKRLVRESFRICQQQLASIDVIVVCYRGSEHISNKEFTTRLEQQWQKLSN